MRRSVSKIIYINVILFFLVYMAFFNDLSRVINIDNLLKSSFSQYCTFAVPSFFMLSGSFFVKINYKKILPNSIKNRIGLENVSQDKMNKERSDNKILIPIFAFLIFGLTITKLLNYKQFTLTYSFKMNNILATGVNYFGGTLITLIVILLILKIFSKLKILKETESEGKNSIKPLLYVFAVLVVLFILSFLLIKYLTNNNYISYFYYTLYFVIGALLTLLALYGKMDEDLEEFINKIAIVFIIISILIILYNPAITSLHNIYGNLYLIDESSIYYFFPNVLLFMGIMLLDETEITVKDFYYINIFYTLYLLISFLVFKHFIGIDSLTRKSSFLTNTNILLISLLFFMISSLLTHLIIFIWNSVTERRKCIDNHPNKNDHKDFTMYDDQPIREESDDRLSRKIMAKKLSEVICNIHFNSSFAIGVSGEWGSGKTSILNMVKNNLDSDIVAVELDPWDTIDNNQLMNNFFSSIIEKLEENEDGSFKQIIREMKQYCYYLNNLSEVIPSTIFKVIRTISFISNYQNQSLKKKKDRLAKKLKNTNKKILVIIDDIDRLSDDRIPFIFQLIASIAKFPNIIYLLAYDKKVVTNALDNLQKDCGEMYLDKCIQLSIDIPNASKDHLNEILQHKITDQNRILNIKEDNSKYENFFDFIMQYIDSVRKINKFINTYTYYCFLLEQEIYYQDILRIVAIQLFQPSLYVCILAHENYFTFSGEEYNELSQKHNNVDNSQDNKSKSKEDVKNILKEYGLDTEDLTDESIKILVSLFPKINCDKESVNIKSVGLRKNFDKVLNLSPIDTALVDVYLKLFIQDNILKESIKTILITLQRQSDLTLYYFLNKINEEVGQISEKGNVQALLEALEECYSEKIYNKEELQKYHDAIEESLKESGNVSK